MNFYLLIRAFVPFLASGVITYLLIRGIIVYKNNPRREIVVYYSIGLGLSALSMLIFSMTPFLTEGQDFYAEITLGGTLILMQVGILIIVQYWHTISREVPVISKMFYLVSGASLMILLIDPDLWVIYYVPGLGYHQELSLLYATILALVLIFGILILFDNLNRVRQVINQELKMIETGKIEFLKGNTQYDKASLMLQTRLLNSKRRLLENKRSLNIITLFWGIGFILLIIGITSPGETSLNADSIGVVLIFFPQAYYYTKDKRLLTLLQVQKVQSRAKLFHESFSELDEKVSSEFSEDSLQSLVKFIEKADALLYFQDHSDK